MGGAGPAADLAGRQNLAKEQIATLEEAHLKKVSFQVSVGFHDRIKGLDH